MRSMHGVTDPGYYILKKKTAPLTDEEKDFIELYENTFVLHLTSIAGTITGSIYFYHYWKAQRQIPLDEARLRWARRRLIFIFPVATALAFTAWTYEKMNRFESRLKEIEDYYIQFKDSDINLGRFGEASPVQSE